MLSESGIVYANGYNHFGQLDGNLEDRIYYSCTPKSLEFESKVVKLFARNNRSAVILENGDAFYWGGISFDQNYNLKNMPKYNGLNKLNDEEGIPKDCKIVDIGLGYLHDLVLIE